MFRRSLIVIIVICSLSPSASIAETFIDDFEEGDLNKWKVTVFPLMPAFFIMPDKVKPPESFCKIEGGRLVINTEDNPMNEPASGAILIADMPDWSDYLIQCRVDDTKLFGGRDSEVMILFRWTPEVAVGNGYGFGYNGRHGGMFGFWKYSGDRVGSLSVDIVGLELPSGIWRIEAKGEDLQFFLNGKLQERAKDKTFLKGKAAIYCYIASVTIDDFFVGTFPSSPVEPQTKLAVTWGKIKVE